MERTSQTNYLSQQQILMMDKPGRWTDPNTDSK